MAYLAYKDADPSTWSIERGYRSYNLNMSVAHVLNLGMLAATLPNHPMAKTWIRSAEAMTDDMLAKNVGPAGEWPESIANYAWVSVSQLQVFSIAAKNAGFRDFINDPRMKRLMDFLGQQWTPPDPRHTEGEKNGTSSLLPPVGRAGAGGRNGMNGMMARATLKDDPAYSAVQQWSWLRTGAARDIPDTRLGGWEYVYMDPDLPAQQPSWDLNYFPEGGAIMRHGIGTQDEWYVYLMTRNDDGYLSEDGGFPAIFAKGAPISARFGGGYSQREELQISRVLLARDRGTKEERSAQFCHEGERQLVGGSALPRQQYAVADFTMRNPMFISHETGPTWDHMKDLPLWPKPAKLGEPPLNWRRQVLFPHDEDPRRGRLPGAARYGYRRSAQHVAALDRHPEAGHPGASGRPGCLPRRRARHEPRGRPPAPPERPLHRRRSVRRGRRVLHCRAHRYTPEHPPPRPGVQLLAQPGLQGEPGPAAPADAR